MIQSDQQASRLLVSDLVENILRYTDNPGDCATYITAQIRELVGVRIVAITTNDELEAHKLVAVCPERKEPFLNQPEMIRFISLASTCNEPRIVDAHSDGGKILSSIGIGTSFIVPLKVGEQRVGLLVLLDLLDLKGAITILGALTRIAPILALILKNSFLYRNMEKLVAARTTELKNSEEHLRRALDNAPFPIMIHAEDGKVVMINSAWTELSGYTHAEIPTTADWAERAYGKRKSIIKKEIENLYNLPGKKNDGEYEVIDSTGKILLWDFSSASLGILPDGRRAVISMARDVTSSKRMEFELQKAQKLESLGLLAGGIAHDFNNLMGGIFGYIDIASEASTENKVTNYLSKAMNTIDRARALTLQLLTFAKGGAPIQTIGKLFPFVEETARFALSGANVSCNFDIPQDLWTCNFDKNQIGQVVDNLIINAQQAMPVGGTITLTARNIALSEKEHPLLENGNYIKISIKDSGIGIPKELIAKIFDPFFTTKAKGHGLGLATCYSIIKRHSGCIDVESEPGKGSTFQIYLPASMEAALSDNQQAAKTHKGSGIFLIMDDEEVMRDTIGDMLETLGYTVVSKENGKDAIEFFASETKANRKIIGMLFDLTVPGGMGGKAAIEEIRKTDTEIPAFVASGYADDPVMKKPAEYGFTASICKPFMKSELSEMLNNYIKPKK